MGYYRAGITDKNRSVTVIGGQGGGCGVLGEVVLLATGEKFSRKMVFLT